MAFIFGGNTGETQESIARKRAIADEMIKGQTRPVDKWSGMANATEKIAGALIGLTADKQSKAMQDNRTQTVAQALAEMRGTPAWTNPDDPSQGIPAGAPDKTAAYSMLSGSSDPQLQDLGMRMQMQDMAGAEAEKTWQNHFGMQNDAATERMNAQQSFQAQQNEASRAQQMNLAKWKANNPAATSTPSNIAEWAAYQRMTPDEQKQYLIMKRANPYLNLGDQMVQPDPTQPGVPMGGFGVGIKPERKIQDDRVITMPAVPGVTPANVPNPAQPMPPANPQNAPPQPIQYTPPDGLRQPAVSPAQTPNASGGVTVQNLPTPPAKIAKAKTALTEFSNNSKFIGDTVDLAIKQASAGGAGVGSVLGNLPGTQANDLRNTLNTLKANVGFDRLQQMRNNSPTGGALGNVSDTEGKLLQSVQGALEPNQSKEQLTRNLEHVKTYYNQLVIDQQNAFAETFGASDGGGSSQKPANDGWSIQKVE